MSLNSARSAGLNGDDLPGIQFARGISSVKSNMATQGINRDHSWRRVLRGGLACPYAHEHHTISGLVDQNLGIDFAAVIFNQIFEIVLLHSGLLFSALRSHISPECYAALTACAMT